MTITTSDASERDAAPMPRRRASRPGIAVLSRRVAAAMMLLVLGLVSMSPVALLCMQMPAASAEAGPAAADDHAHHEMPAPAGPSESPAHESHGMPNDCLRHCASAPVVALPGISAAVVAVAPIAVPARVEARAAQRPAQPARLLPFANGPPAAGLART